jgi:hypothetical protein
MKIPRTKSSAESVEQNLYFTALNVKQKFSQEINSVGNAVMPYEYPQMTLLSTTLNPNPILPNFWPIRS